MTGIGRLHGRAARQAGSDSVSGVFCLRDPLLLGGGGATTAGCLFPGLHEIVY